VLTLVCLSDGLHGYLLETGARVNGIQKHSEDKLRRKCITVETVVGGGGDIDVGRVGRNAVFRLNIR
jgi:hypothetical protein